MGDGEREETGRSGQPQAKQHHHFLFSEHLIPINVASGLVTRLPPAPGLCSVGMLQTKLGQGDAQITRSTPLGTQRVIPKYQAWEMVCRRRTFGVPQY